MIWLPPLEARSMDASGHTGVIGAPWRGMDSPSGVIRRCDGVTAGYTIANPPHYAETAANSLSLSSLPGIAVRRTASLPLAYDPATHHLREKIFVKSMDARVEARA
jgi:hypothetical protein